MADLVSDSTAIQREICQTLGLNPAQVASLTIGIAPGLPVLLTVERYISADEAQQLRQCMEKYAVIRRRDE